MKHCLSAYCALFFASSSYAGLCLQSQEPWIDGLASLCETYSGSLCVHGVLASAFKFDSTWFDVYNNDSTQYSSYIGGITFYGSPFKGLQLSNASVSACDGVTDSLLLTTFDSTFILFPDSIPVSVGDTITLDHYLAYWTQDLPFVWKYWVYIKQGSFTVNGALYSPPVAMRTATSQRAPLSFIRNPASIQVTNPDSRAHKARLVGADGHLWKSILLQPGESQIMDANQSLFLQVIQ